MNLRSRKSGKNHHQAATVHRCGIYSRKSTTEGLDSDFSTLDAQREACEAYILSQKGQGWVAIPERFDDGGYSGSNMDRPALKKLIAFVETGKIDCIVVYKIDRISRSLADFSNLIVFLEKHKTGFISITQSFNTSDSAGRLMMNILLSFAQYERELIADRTRDKMCAARRKGKWIGGVPMLGYDIDPKGGRLVINQEEAALVKEIFRLYLEFQSLLEVAGELNRRGWSTKSWIKKDGTKKQGKPFTKTGLHSLLTNVTYLGKVEHQGEIYEGEQAAIIEESLWSQVQQLMIRNSRTNGIFHRNKHGALLKGLVCCVHCNSLLFHTYTKKKEKLYRYYTCSAAQKKGSSNCPNKSVPAFELEKFVVNRVREIGGNQQILYATLDKVRAELISRKKPLLKERGYLKKQQDQYQVKIKNLVEAIGGGEQDSASLRDHLSETEEQLNNCINRLSEISRELIIISKPEIDKNDFKNALSLFDPIWNLFFPREQARVIQLLIDNIAFDGQNGSLEITFSPLGINALSTEIETAKKEYNDENTTN